METISNWGLLLAIFGILILVISLSLILYFRDYLGVYKSPKVVLSIAIPGLIYGEYLLWQLVLADIQNVHRLEWPDQSLILMVIGYSLLVVAFGIVLRLYGKQWWVRQHYRNYTSWGPYLTLGSQDSNALCFCWRNSSLNASNSSYGSNLVHNNSANPLLFPSQYTSRIMNPKLHSKLSALSWFRVPNISSFQNLPNLPLRYQISGNSSSYSIDSRYMQGLPTEFTVFIAGDLHAGGDEIMPLVKCLESRIPDIDFVLTLGDVVSNAQSLNQWKTFFGQFQSILPRIPFVYLPGNHDGYAKKRCMMWRTLFWQPYVDEADGSYFSFAYKHCVFITLDNYNKKGQFLGFSEKQFIWLKQELETAQENVQIHTIFLCLHHPPYSTGNEGCHPQFGSLFLDFIEQFPKIHAVFSGHAHIYQRFTVPLHSFGVSRNVHFLILGGGGKLANEVLKRWDPGPYQWTSDGKTTPPAFIPRKSNHQLRNDAFIAKYHQKSMITHHYLLMSVRNGQIQYQIYDWENRLIDQF